LEMTPPHRNHLEAYADEIVDSLGSLENHELSCLLRWALVNTQYFDSIMIDILDAAVEESCERLGKL
jgi:hypothetical protein